MGMPAKDLTGLKFGYLTAMRRHGTASSARATWLCQCDCGAQVVRTSQYLRDSKRSGKRSCGCYHNNTKHGMTDSRPFKIWSNMRNRCLTLTDKDYAKYGGAGISVCPSWAKSFEAFWADMQPGYADHLTLDRIDGSKGYCKSNCRWATMQEQQNNRKDNVWLDTPKGRMTVSQAAKAYGLKVITLHARLFRYKWDLTRALTTPGRMTY